MLCVYFDSKVAGRQTEQFEFQIPLRLLNAGVENSDNFVFSQSVKYLCIKSLPEFAIYNCN